MKRAEKYLYVRYLINETWNMASIYSIMRSFMLLFFLSFFLFPQTFVCCELCQLEPRRLERLTEIFFLASPIEITQIKLYSIFENLKAIKLKMNNYSRVRTVLFFNL